MPNVFSPGYKEATIGEDRSGTFLLSGAVKCFVVALLSITALPLSAAEDVEYDPDRIEFILGNLVFVTLHEIAHIVIEDFDIPVLGNNEDAADSLATVHLIREDRARPEQDLRLIRMLLTAADAQRILWQQGLETDNPAVYLARHPLSVQRAARIYCLAFGSDPELFEPLPDLVGLPESRAFWCEEEYADAEQAYLWVSESILQIESSGTAIDHQFVYGAARGPGHESIRNWLMQNQVLERTVALGGATVLTEPITLRTLSCDYPDAYWDIDERELVICYELIEAFYELSANQGITELAEQIRAFHRDGRASNTN